MAGVASVAAPALLHDGDAVPPETAILFVVVSLFVGIVSRQMLHNTKVPYTVALLLIGIGLGALEYGTRRGLGALGDSIRMWSNIDPNLILYVFLPALLFESSFSMEVHQIKRCLVQMLLLAGPGVIISTVCLGLVHRYVFPYDWSWSVSLLLGGLLSATDPVAVVALLKEIGASKKLGTIIEGESLMNDGTAMVVFELFRRMVFGKHFTAGKIVEFLIQVAAGAVVLGMALGVLSVLWVGFMFNDTIMEITLTFTISYCAFFVAQSVAEVSGVLSVISVGIIFGAFARAAFRGESQQSMHHFWNIITYFANTLIFILSGVVIAENFLRSQAQIERQDWGYLVLLYVFLQLSRLVVVAVLYPGLRYYGYGLTLKEAAVLTWAGLRGAVALALSLSVHDTRTSTDFSDKTQAKFVFFTGGVVFLTLIINGSSTQFLLRFLHMEKTTETKRLVLEHVKYEMNRKAAEAFEELGEDEELGPADWATVRKYVSCVRRFHEEERPAHPHHLTPGEHQALNENEARRLQLQDTRVRFLNGVQAAYWEMLEEGRVTQTAALLLMQSVDEALDTVVEQERLLDWKGLRPHVHFPSYLKHLQTENLFLPQKLLTYLAAGRLDLSCYISAAFLRAHVIVRRHLRDFIGETEVSKMVIRESEQEAGEAKQFLEDVRLTFPQVLRVVKTKQVVHAILVRLLVYIQDLEKAGLLEDRETAHLHNLVEEDLKSLLRKPPSVKMPKGAEVSLSQPFVGGLPSQAQSTLVTSARECLKLRGNFLYKQGSRVEGLWLIASGVVRWGTGDSDLVHPTFSHGSTLGLYEVLTGKPYLCDVTADSVVQCFFVEGSKVLAILQSYPELEQFFWQESTLAVAKIVLPNVFEATPMQELRSFVQNCSPVSFLRGEVVEIGAGEVAILLEGFVKKEGKGDLIGAPAGLVFQRSSASPPETRRLLSGRVVHHGSIFHVETRSRFVIINLSVEFFASSSSLLPRRSSLGRDSFSLRNRRRNSDAQHSFRVPPPSSEPIAAEASKVPSQWKRGSTGQIMPDEDPSGLLPPQIVRSASAAGQNLISRGRVMNSGAPLPPLRIRSRKQPAPPSDDEDEEEEHIVQIESPSSLFHNNNFGRQQ